MDSTDSRTALAGIAGGAGWLAFPFGTLAVADTHAPGPAGLAWIAVTMTLGAALLVAGIVGLRARHRGTFGRLGVTGTVLTAIAVALMGGGLGTELVTLAVADQLNDIGHAATMIGFLLLLPGSILLGIAVAKARVLASARALGTALALTVPVGIGLAALAGMLGIGGAESDFGFWLGLTAPTGLAWILLGSALRRAADRVPVAA